MGMWVLHREIVEGPSGWVDIILLIIPKRQGFTIIQVDNYGTSSGDDEGNCEYN